MSPRIVKVYNPRMHQGLERLLALFPLTPIANREFGRKPYPYDYGSFFVHAYRRNQLTPDAQIFSDILNNPEIGRAGSDQLVTAIGHIRAFYEDQAGRTNDKHKRDALQSDLKIMRTLLKVPKEYGTDEEKRVLALVFEALDNIQKTIDIAAKKSY